MLTCLYSWRASPLDVDFWVASSFHQHFKMLIHSCLAHWSSAVSWLSEIQIVVPLYVMGHFSLPVFKALTLNLLVLRICRCFGCAVWPTGILVPWLGVKPVVPAVEAQTGLSFWTNHWTARRVPEKFYDAVSREFSPTKCLLWIFRVLWICLLPYVM